MTQIETVTRQDDLDELTAALRKERVVGIDLEMDALHNYREKVCLVQVSTPDRNVIIDPLATLRLDVLAPVFDDESIRKIFHAADYDVRCLRRDYGFTVRNLFDTMISAQFCGEEKIGLADLLQKYFGVELDKKYQRADWSQRPLKPEMVRYAADDTRYLHRLADILENRLRELGRLEWVREECACLEEVAFEPNDGPLFLRFKGAGTLDRRQLAVLEEILQWRDREAERRNCPHFKVLGNRQAMAMAQSMPSDVAGLKAIEGLSPRQVERYGRSLLNGIRTARALDEAALPHFPRSGRAKRDPGAEKILTRLKAWRADKAAALNLEPGVLINNALLEAIARTRPKKIDDLGTIRGLRRWQIGELGRDLVAVCNAARNGG